MTAIVLATKQALKVYWKYRQRDNVLTIFYLTFINEIIFWIISQTLLNCGYVSLDSSNNVVVGHMYFQWDFCEVFEESLSHLVTIYLCFQSSNTRK